MKTHQIKVKHATKQVKFIPRITFHSDAAGVSIHNKGNLTHCIGIKDFWHQVKALAK
jgi:hypothetical protein